MAPGAGLLAALAALRVGVQQPIDPHGPAETDCHTCLHTQPTQAEKGAAGDKALRPWWRGRVGLNKDEQKELWARGLKDIEDL